MEKERKINQYREKLDKTLSSPELTNAQTLKSLIKEQLKRSSIDETKEYSEALLDRRNMEVSNFLNMLRSASLEENEGTKGCNTAQPAWKLKQDTEELRVMYREGPNGSPYHSLLVEGYIDGPLDVCMCVNWESALYKKWWPQYTIPTFKIISCKRVQKIQIGEQISLVRVKLSWPMSTREAVVHFFEFEFLQDDLIVVLLNTIPDLESIDESSHGFTKDGIPEAKDVVRIDLLGGYALQKVTPERSYFRTIVNMDMKLDFIPPSLINFISRQLIGNGFKLYQKVVSSVKTSDDDFSKALGDPLYSRIHSAIYSVDHYNIAFEQGERKSETLDPSKEHTLKDVQNDLLDVNGKVGRDDHATEPLVDSSQMTDSKAFGGLEEKTLNPSKEHISESVQNDLLDGNGNMERNDHATEPLADCSQMADSKTFGEIEEERCEERTAIQEKCEDRTTIQEKCEDRTTIQQASKDRHKIHGNITAQNCSVINGRNVHISYEVLQALGTLEKAIYMVREYGFNTLPRSSSGLTDEELSNTKVAAENNPASLNTDSNGAALEKKVMDTTAQEPRTSSGSHSIRHTESKSYVREITHNKVAPASPGQDRLTSSEIDNVDRSSFVKETTEAFQNSTHDNEHVQAEVIGVKESSLKEVKLIGKRRKQWRLQWLRCFPLNYRR